MVMARKSLYPISNIFLNRWSSRALSNEPVINEQLMKLFEAARWAPSSYNEQPWRFIYTRKGTPTWDSLLGLMLPINQIWAKNAPVFVVLISKTFFDRNTKPSHTHTFDAGAAWMSLALQGSIDGLVIHAIADFDYEKAQAFLNLPPEFKIEIIIAIGNPGNKEALPAELQIREKPSDRKSLKEIVFEDAFK
jgi:nitroreductase